MNAIFAELMPTSRPERSINGPPLLPGINRGVGLEQIVVIGVVDRDVAFHATENAAADRAAVAERVADDDDGLANKIR